MFNAGLSPTVFVRRVSAGGFKVSGIGKKNRSNGLK
jgi:hypothetical protein